MYSIYVGEVGALASLLLSAINSFTSSHSLKSKNVVWLLVVTRLDTWFGEQYGFTTEPTRIVCQSSKLKHSSFRDCEYLAAVVVDIILLRSRLLLSLSLLPLNSRAYGQRLATCPYPPTSCLCCDHQSTASMLRHTHYSMPPIPRHNSQCFEGHFQGKMQLSI